MSRHFEIDLRARGRSARPAAGFSIRCVPPLCTAGFGTARDGRAPAGSERDAAERVGGRAGRDDVWCRLQQRVGVLLCVRALDDAPRPSSSPASVASPVTAALTSPVLLPALRAAPTFQLTRYYRYGELDSCEGRWAAIWACMDRKKRRVRDLPSCPRRFAPSSSPTRDSPVARSDTSRPLHARFARRNGEALSAKARVPVENAPERGKPYWTLLDPREAGRLWRRNFGDKVPAEDETGMGDTRP